MYNGRWKKVAYKFKVLTQVQDFEDLISGHLSVRARQLRHCGKVWSFWRLAIRPQARRPFGNKTTGTTPLTDVFFVEFGYILRFVLVLLQLNLSRLITTQQFYLEADIKVCFTFVDINLSWLLRVFILKLTAGLWHIALPGNKHLHGRFFLFLIMSRQLLNCLKLIQEIILLAAVPVYSPTLLFVLLEFFSFSSINC